MKAQYLIHNDRIAYNVGIAIRNNWQELNRAKAVIGVADVLVNNAALMLEARLRSKINYILKTEAIKWRLNTNLKH